MTCQSPNRADQNDASVQCQHENCVRRFGTEWARKIHHTQVHTNGPSDEEFLAALRRLADELERTPRKKDMDLQGPHSSPTYQDRFGSWNDALERAGLEPNLVHDTARKVECDSCSRSIVRQPYKLQENEHQFCSKECYGDWKAKNPGELMLSSQTGKASPVWKGGYVSPEYGPNWRAIRRGVLNRDEHVCQSCTMTEEEHVEEYGRSLNIHHIRPVKSFESPEQSHSMANLVTLCTPCHGIYEGHQCRPITARILPREAW
ncbi:homing endonuclease associated repeat-containing protein [Halomarina rubra]|uniref:Homing endonuclease associated repeat-containing protein n=1 Tax=Halomarina rubra TaxID=2071873 RepID=A0ABD6B1I3_9EURY